MRAILYRSHVDHGDPSVLDLFTDDATSLSQLSVASTALPAQ